MEKKLYRDEYHKKVAGVCAGLAEYFSVDVAIVRVLFVLALVLHGGGLLVYIVLWIALPKKPYGYTEPVVDYKVPPQNPGGQFNEPYASNTFSGSTWNDNAFSSNPFPKDSFIVPQRKTSTTGLVFGLILIVIGASFLLDEFDLIPYWDIARLWPLVLIIIGGGLIFSGQKKQPWEKTDWHKAENKEETDTKAADPSTETHPTDNNPTI